MVKRFIEFVKMDFMRVRWALDCLVGRKVPLGIFILYYAIMAPIGYALYPFGKLYSIWYFRHLDKEIKRSKKELEEYLAKMRS